MSPSNRRQVVAWSSTGLTQSGAFRAPAKNNQNLSEPSLRKRKDSFLDFQKNIDGISGPVDPHNRAAQAETDKELVCVQNSYNVARGNDDARHAYLVGTVDVVPANQDLAN